MLKSQIGLPNSINFKLVQDDQFEIYQEKISFKYSQIYKKAQINNSDMNNTNVLSS